MSTHLTTTIAGDPSEVWWHEIWLWNRTQTEDWGAWHCQSKFGGALHEHGDWGVNQSRPSPHNNVQWENQQCDQHCQCSQWDIKDCEAGSWHLSCTYNMKKIYIIFIWFRMLRLIMPWIECYVPSPWNPVLNPCTYQLRNLPSRRLLGNQRQRPKWEPDHGRCKCASFWTCACMWCAIAYRHNAVCGPLITSKCV